VGKEANMKITGCDFHPSYQQIAVLDSVTGEMVEKALSHERKDEVRAFYAGLAPASPLLNGRCECGQNVLILRIPGGQV
jgi:hypothetical protein